MWLLTHTDFDHSQSISYSDLLHHLKIPSLASRRVQHDLQFLRNLIRGKVDCPVLLESFPLHAPSRSTRTVSVFTVPRARVRTVDSGMSQKVMNTYLGSARQTQMYFTRA